MTASGDPLPSSVRIDRKKARKVLREEYERADELAPDPDWAERLSEFQAATTQYKTYIAILATALLARSTDVRANPYALKVGDGDPGSYAARSLATKVLVPEAGVLGIDLGVTGSEPHNNQPFFRATSVSLEMASIIKQSARPALDALISCLAKTAACATEEEARVGLRSFIAMHRRGELPPLDPGAERPASPAVLARLMTAFVDQNSEGGKRAQAVAAGLLDVAHGRDSVRAGRINDPSRHHPGDVAIASEGGGWDLVIEVKDKPVHEGDLRLFARRVVQAGVPRAGYVAVASKQAPLDVRGVVEWCGARGVAYQVFLDWESLLHQVLTWAVGTVPALVGDAYRAIDARLIEAEVSPEGLAAWREWTTAAGDS